MSTQEIEQQQSRLKDLIAKGKKIAALVMDVPVDSIEFSDDGRFTSRNTNKTLDFLELAKEAANIELPDELKSGVSIVTDNEMHDPVFPNGTAICEVEVDPDTGHTKIVQFVAADDFGNVINPMIVEGQVHGGIAQGVGQALLEGCHYDPTSGQLTANGHQATERTPRAFALDPSGRFVYVAGQGSGRVAVYSVAPATGLLTPVETVTVGGGPLWVSIR